ncbi:MAG: chromosome segregation protein SMC, partial [Propionibacteriaceae bacterium]
LEQALDGARAAEVAAEDAVRQGVPRLAAAQETWYSLAALRERDATTLSIARERMRQAEDDPGELLVRRDPDELDREAARVAAQEKELSSQVEAKARALEAATSDRSRCEDAERGEENRLAALIRAAADRREGLARLTGQVNSLRSRGEAAAAEISRLTTAQRQAAERAEHASRAFTALETRVAGLDAGEFGLDADHEATLQTLDGIEKQQTELRRQEQVATQERAALAARVEALRVGLTGKDARSALLAASDQLNGLLGSVATLVRVQAPYETAIAAAFGAAADAVAVTGMEAAVGAFDHLKAEDLGRAGLLLGGVVESERIEQWPALPPGARYAVEFVEVPDQL